MKFITVSELKSELDNNIEWQLIDVREPYELEIASIDCLKIPMAEIPNRINEISKEIKVVIFCKSGNRSKAVVNLLTSEYGFEKIYSLEGGITAWATEIDNSLEIY